MLIRFNQPEGNLFGPQIIELMRVIREINSNSEQDIEFDFSQITFFRPLFTLTLTGLIFRLRNEGRTVTLNNLNNEYYKFIFFEKGMMPDDMADWEVQLSNYSSKSYFPILNFPTSKDPDNVKLRNDSISCVARLIKQKINPQPDVFNAISYLISEMTDNISDHSGAERGFLFAQYYAAENYIDICILDTGKTILGSYLDGGVDGITNSMIAIEKATQGLSTKDKQRGKGIPTSRKLIVNGMKGKFGLVSGNAILQNEQITELPTTWPGTFLALRIPKTPAEFDFYKYID